MIIITDDCISCGMCLEECPIGAIQVKPSRGYSKAFIDKRICVNCGTCLDSGCPGNAIVRV
jgi:ferredoxin